MVEFSFECMIALSSCSLNSLLLFCMLFALSLRLCLGQLLLDHFILILDDGIGITFILIENL